MATTYRHEHKYILTPTQDAILSTKAACILGLDKHAEADSRYSINSLYFDDLENSFLHDNIDGVDNRVKYRLRYYNNPSFVRLEKKSKVNGMTRKESCAVSQNECELLINGKYRQLLALDSIISNNIKHLMIEEMASKILLPKVIVSYCREAYVHVVGNVRITFDRNITASNDCLAFLSGTYRQIPLIGNNSIVEVKWDDILPKYIMDVLNINKLTRSAFSKYSICRKIINL